MLIVTAKKQRRGGGMVYTEDLKSSAERLKGSTPFRGTNC